MARPRQAGSAKGYRAYLLAVLAIIYAFNFIDVQALGLVMQNIKETFRVSDTDLGMLTGIAFTVFYSTLGIPIGRWADRGNRVGIIALALGLRSIAVMLTGIAHSFNQLLLLRIGVAAGEAGCLPPAISLIADYFSQAERPRATAIYFVGGPLSALIGYFAGGWLNQLYGWHTMFVVIGSPGIFLMAVAWSTLREPRLVDGGPVAEPTARVRPAATLDVCKTLWRNRTFRHILAMLCVEYFFLIGAGQWQPVFFIRSYGMTTMELGIWFSLIFGVGGIVGTYLGGSLATRYAPRDESRQLKVMVVLNVIFGVVSAFAYLSPNRYVSLILTGAATVGLALVGAPLYAAIQTVVPESMRASAVSIVLMFANLVGAGLGPLAVGALSDALRPSLGEESLRFALLATCPGFLWGGWHLWLAAHSVVSDTERASGQSPSTSADGAHAYSR